MTEKKENRLTNKFLIWVVLPIFLFTTWLTLSLTYLINYIVYKDYSFSVLSHNHKYLENSEIKQHFIRGEFTATNDYLGVLLLRFDGKNTTLNTKINFRIKEKGKKNWYHTLTTNTLHIRYLPLFPFGFPVIENSRGKTYLYEVEIIKKSPNNKLALSNKTPQVISKYQYPKELLLSNRSTLFSFAVTKILYILTNSYFALISLVYGLPFIFYILLLVLPEKIILEFIPPSARKFLKGYVPFLFEYPNFFIFLALVLLSDVLFVPMRLDIFFIVIIGVWFYFIRKYRFTPDVSFFIANLFILLSAFLFIFFLPKNSEKAAIWGFFFLVSGTIHYIFSLFQKKKISKL